MKKSLFLVAILFAVSFARSQSIIETLTITSSDLNSTQLDNYNKILSHNSYSDIHFVSVNISEQTVTNEGLFLFSLPYLPDYIPTSINFKLSNFGIQDGDNFHFSGNHVNFQQTESDTLYGHSSFLITKVVGRYTGHFSLERESYEIYDLTGGVQVFCHDNSVFPEGAHDCATTIESSTIPEQTESTGCKDRKIKILFLYTHEAELVESDMTGKVNQCINDLNNIWSNSGIADFHFEIAGTEKIQFSETNSIFFDLVNMRSMSFTQSKRSQYNAEIVVFLTNGNYANAPPNIVNNVNLNAPASGVASGIGVDFANGFALVEIIQATTGRHTFAHEVSHLFGARHDVDLTQNNTHGHNFKTGAGVFNWGGIDRKTLMCVIPSGESRIEHVSNPTVKFMNVPTGTPYHNNAQEGINYFIDPIASFYNDAHNPITSVVRVDCGQWKDYWMAKIIDYCPTNETGPFTYNWYYADFGSILATAFLGSPLQWNYLTTGNAQWIYIANPYNYVKCEIRNSNNVLLYTGYKGIYGIDNAGNCVTYRSENISTGIETSTDAAANNISVYPNPNTGNFYINVEGLGDISKTQIQIFNQLGQTINIDKLRFTQTTNGELKVEGSQTLAEGIYMLKIGDNLGANKSCRILVSK